MAQLNVDQYKRLTGTMVYGQSDGLYWDSTNSQLVMVMGDAVVARVDTTGITADLEFSGEARGDIMRRGASAWEVHSAKGSGKILVGDGTDLASVAVSGDATLDSAGGVTLADPQRIYSESVALTATTIVGTSAGDIGHASGVQLVPAATGKIIEPVAIVITYTFDTAAYTDGGNIYAIYDGGAAATGVASAANSLGAGASNITVLRPLSGLVLKATDLRLVAAAGFTQPGTAAGTADVLTYYRLLDN